MNRTKKKGFDDAWSFHMVAKMLLDIIFTVDPRAISRGLTWQGRGKKNKTKLLKVM